jgi:hypothetical protein
VHLAAPPALPPVADELTDGRCDHAVTVTAEPRQDDYLTGNRFGSPTGAGFVGSDPSNPGANAMSDISTTIDTYLEAYCEPDAARRDELVARVWAENGELLDPPLEGTGRTAISGLADVVNTHYPAHTFRRTSGIDAHHDVARYAWELVAPDGSVAVTGVDTVELNDHGQLVRVVGFFGELPPKE